MELNELIYAVAKLVCDEIGVSQKEYNREIRLETQIRNLRHQAKMSRKRKNVEICLDEKKKATQHAKQYHSRR